MSTQGRVQLEQVQKTFGKVVALQGVELDIAPGEFFTLLGPSGCGKTTLLRIVAGLETPTRGTIRIDNQVVNDLSPGERDIAMVFQSYALYAHMKVFDNIAFPLRMVKTPEPEIRKRVEQVAERLHIQTLLDRKPGQLSGGQQQRVALGRAIVREPRVFLLDEPLSNLDARLRLEMRIELKALQSNLGVTTIYVTHDQEEAMTMSSRIAVFESGRVLQVGTPEEIYSRPATVSVARFVGTLPMNFFLLQVVEERGILQLQGEYIRHQPAPEIQHSLRQSGIREVLLGIRPKDIQLFLQPPVDALAFPTRVFLVEPIGDYTVVNFQLGETLHKIRLPTETALRPGQPIWVAIPDQAAHLFDAKTGNRIDPPLLHSRNKAKGSHSVVQEDE